MHYKTWNDVYDLDIMYYKKLRVDIDGKVVVSLTTIPDRIGKISPTLYSILNQTVRVDEIRINIPYYSMKGEKYVIPYGIKDLENIKIRRVDKDLGPATKLLPTSKYEKYDTKIIVIDDDSVYGSCFVENLVKTFKKRKERDVITTYGSDINIGSCERIYNFYRGNKHVHRLFGCGGYILTPDMLPKEIYDYSDAPKDAIYVDDNWISGWLNLNGIKIYMMGMKYGCIFFPSINCIGTISLSSGTNKNNKHERRVNRWFIKKGAYI